MLAVVIASGCAASDIRGQSTASPDGRTYPIIADDNGGKCGPLLVEREVWPRPINRPGMSALPACNRLWDRDARAGGFGADLSV
jgi:hypothetical protein